MTSILFTTCDICKKDISGENKYHWKIERFDNYYFKYGDVCIKCIKQVESLLNIKK